MTLGQAESLAASCVVTARERLVERATAAGLAVWDVVATCRREGSADATIRDVEVNDIGGLVARSPELRAIALNGAKAATLFDRHVVPANATQLARLELIRVPSTSPANASIPRAAKVEAWRAVARWLHVEHDSGRGIG